MTKILDPRAGAFEMGPEFGCLFVDPARDIAEHASLLGRRTVLRERQRGGEQDRAGANAHQQR